MKVNIQIPFFPGFYETDLMNSDTAYWAIKDELEYYQRDYAYDDPDEQAIYAQLQENDLDFRYSDYEHDLAEAFLEVWHSHAPGDIVESVGEFGIDSPRYYNFRNDELFADVTLKEGWQDVMRHFIALNYDWLKERVHEDWTSYDGFCSFMENDLDEWESHLFGEMDERYISTMIGYMMYRENEGIYHDLIMSTLEDIYEGQYVFITDEGKERLQQLRDQREEDIREGRVVLPDPDQMKISFPED